MDFALDTFKTEVHVTHWHAKYPVNTLCASVVWSAEILGRL